MDSKKIFLGLICSLSPLVSWAGPTASITDTAIPIQIDGDLTDWKSQPVITLDQKTNVVVGQGDWTGPDYASAKIYITYDKTNLYIAADITDKTPQYNEQDASSIYNGDALEVYVGTDNSNPQRNSYAPTDVQLVISPGKNGDGAQVYSVTDKAVIPNAQVASKLTATGYTMEASIPLVFFYKLDMGPNKSLGFDIGLDDCGANSKTRTIQLTWSGSDKSWQDPSVWGSLQFTGNTVFVNTTPKVAMPGAVSNDMDPQAGKKGASTQGVLLWGFNDDTGGFAGSVDQETDITSEGAGALAIHADGSQGWNQNLAVCQDIPMPDKWENLKAISMDVYFASGSLAKAGFGELYLVTQSPTNNWYEIKMHMQEGWNHVKQEVDGTQFKGGVTKVYLVLNSGGPISGDVIVDNIRGIMQGAAATLTGTVTNSTTGQPVPNAMVAVAKQLVTAGADGSFSISVPEDEYTGEVFAPGFKSDKESIAVSASSPKPWNISLAPDNPSVKTATADIFFGQKIRTIDPHYMYGNNIAVWYDPKWLTDPTAVQKVSNVASYFRLPGGAYGNIWRWKTGEVLNKDGSVQWTPDVKWPQLVNFVKSVPGGEPLMVANIMTMDVQNCLDWIADAKAQGLPVKYVELGNEPDYEPNMQYQGQTDYWTVIDNYCQHYLEFAKAIKAQYPDIKLMGPAVAQVENHERKEGSPWLAGADAPWWVEKFLEECGPYVDVVSVHSYPYWSNDSDSNLLQKTSHWAEFVPKIRAAIRKNIPDRADKIEIAVTEWNSGDEVPATAKLVNGIFCTDYLAQMMLWGINQANLWDCFTQKPGQGGGHGMIDPNNDPDHPYEERAHYWGLYMLEHYFGTTLYQTASDSDDLDVYASTGNGKEYLLFINKSPKYAYQTTVNLGPSQTTASTLDFYQLSSREYQWSETLYRPVIDSGPSHFSGSQPVKNGFQYTFPPYSITCVDLTPQN